ncbi:MAG: transcriptional regulator [Flavobacteriaceae bacterium]|nr:transcriptional regulator [Flavobacteriaceae bacterium]
MGIIDNINKLFDHRIRLGIMSILVVNENADFNRLKELLDVTDGNLASHIKALEQAEYVLVEKSFVGRKPNTNYTATKLGRTEFKKHIEALEKLIQPPNPQRGNF